MSAHQVFYGRNTVDVTPVGTLAYTLQTSYLEIRAVIETAAEVAKQEGLRHTAERLLNDLKLIEQIHAQCDPDSARPAFVIEVAS